MLILTLEFEKVGNFALCQNMSDTLQFFLYSYSKFLCRTLKVRREIKHPDYSRCRKKRIQPIQIRVDEWRIKSCFRTHPSSCIVLDHDFLQKVLQDLLS